MPVPVGPAIQHPVTPNHIAADDRYLLQPEDMSPSWLTAALHAAGHLTRGRVESVTVTLWRKKTHSVFYRCEATYDAERSAPPTFILKASRPEVDSTTARRRRWKEFEFYGRLVPEMTSAPVPTAFAVAYDPLTHQSHLLLEDLNDSHTRPPAPLPATADQLRGDVDCLAHIHACWWEHPDLAGVGDARDARWISERTAAARRNLARFMREYGGYIPASIRDALETACSSWPAILQRSTVAPLTVVHGDAHPWNFLTPREPDDPVTRLLDWEGWSIEPGPHDLASLIALHLPGAMRRALEDELLDWYHQRLRDYGIEDYDPAACHLDYRLAVARRVVSPVSMWSRGSQARSWWPMLERASEAFHDLRCEEVL